MPHSKLRDLVGYGKEPPNPAWPKGARLALQFVINYEEGGERTLANGDPESEGYLTELVGLQSVRGRRDHAAESLYEYGSRAGFWRLHRLFASYDVPVTVYGVTTALEKNPEAVAAMLQSNWEVASHGLRWIDYGDMNPDVERWHLQQAISRHSDVVGSRPLGWYTGRISPNTRDLLIEEGGFLYDSDDYADDLPYWTGTVERPHLVIPYALDSNDCRYAMPQGFNTGSQFLEYLTDSLAYLYEEGARSPKMLSVGLHCRISGRPGRAAALQRFLDLVCAKPDIWICRRVDIARHWWDHFRP